MGARRNIIRSTRILASIFFLSIFSIFALLFFLHKVDDFVSHRKTVAGHNLEPTPWHPFEPKRFSDVGPIKYGQISTIFHCSILLTCPQPPNPGQPALSPNPTPSCPSFFHWIHHDLAPWTKSRISISNLNEARNVSAFRLIISGGRLYVDFYYDCVQSRTMFTIWGMLQLLKRYPGRVPDVDLMFDCMDKPVIERSQYNPSTKPPPPLFRYCTTKDHFDIPFPDWSFWGWPEVNIGPWDEEFRSIKVGSQALKWTKKHPVAYWKGNPDVMSPVRAELLKCNDSRTWGAQIMRQNWGEEARTGFDQSKLSKQCNHRYKIYAEGYAWSVSLKYIISCGSLSLIIDPQYEDFFSRGLAPRKSYWPVSSSNLCKSIKFAVDWGNEHPLEAEAIGKGGQDFMQDLNMEHVYDYMYHLIVEYSKLLDFEPIPPPSAQEICEESLLCFADSKQKQFLKRSSINPSSSYPCSVPPDNHGVERWIKEKQETIDIIRKLEKMQA